MRNRLDKIKRLIPCLLLLSATVAVVGCTQGATPSGAASHGPADGPAPQAADDLTFSISEAGGDDCGTAVVKRFATVSSGENLQVLDKALECIFPGGTQGPGEAQVLDVLSYVAQTLELKASARHLGSEVLSDGQAYCYGFARAFEALCRRMGLPARINAVHNFGYMQAHNMAEVFYGGRWHLFDPTYGSFFYDREEYDGSGDIPSLRELMSGTVTGSHVFMVCETLWSGDYRRDCKVHPLADDFRYRGLFTQRELYDRVLSTAFPLNESELSPSSFPITMDMGDSPRLSIGQLDGSPEDLEGRTREATYPRYQGTGLLGRGAMGPAFHTITLKASAPGRFKMTYHLLPQSRFEGMGVVELRDVIVERQETGRDAWSVWFRLQTREGLFLVVNRQGAALLDAITVERVE